MLFLMFLMQICVRLTFVCVGFALGCVGIFLNLCAVGGFNLFGGFLPPVFIFCTVMFFLGDLFLAIIFCDAGQISRPMAGFIQNMVCWMV